jgi:hypothetical protein
MMRLPLPQELAATFFTHRIEFIQFFELAGCYFAQRLANRALFG